MIDLLEVLEKIRNPDLLDYIRSGRGIEARYKRCKPFWQNHLRNCKAFQAKHIAEHYKRDVSVLGAGRCYDFDLSRLSSHFERVHLFDADPGCLPVWKQTVSRNEYGTRVIPHLGDLTASITPWTKDLAQFLKANAKASKERLAGFLNSLETNQAPIIPGEVIISLNLLGQIPIYWRDRVHSRVSKELALETDERGFYPNSLQTALDRTFRILQQQHLQALAASSAELILLFTDIDYSYFKPDLADWQVERAIYVDGLEIPGYGLQDKERWYWNLAPLGVEHKEYGEVHQVEARAFVRRI